MKRTTTATLLNLVLPGAGLWFCGRPKLALANLLLAAGIPLLGFSVGFIEEHVPWVFLAVAAGSAGFAHAVASRSATPG
jgi:hypothetical protein